MKTSMKIIICEYAPGRTEAFARWLPEAVVIRRHLGERVPEIFDGIIFAGGPMSAHEADRQAFPFLEEDFALMKTLAAQEHGPWMAGVCLGAQLITFALGGEVTEGEFVRGWNRLRPTSDDILFDACDDPTQFEFHRNHITKLPPGAKLLADSDQDSIEAYRMGNRILVVAYHPEIVVEDANRIYTMARLTAEERHEDRFLEPPPSARRASEQFFFALDTLGKGEGL